LQKEIEEEKNRACSMIVCLIFKLNINIALKIDVISNAD
jgi:hypothetical protein